MNVDPSEEVSIAHWDLATRARRLVHLQFVETIPLGMAGCYYHHKKSKWLDRVLIRSSLSVEHQVCVMAHELAHVMNSRTEPARWAQYFNSLEVWSCVDFSTDIERVHALRIYEEECLAEERGLRMIREYKSLVELYEQTAALSLGEYHKRLGL